MVGHGDEQILGGGKTARVMAATEQTSSGEDDPASTEHPARRPIIVTRLLAWVVFGVIFGGLPLIADGVRDEFSAGGLDLNLVLVQGGLFIVSAVMAAGAIGELFMAKLPDNEHNFRIIVGGGCLLFCLGNAIAYVASTTSVACLTAEDNTVNASVPNVQQLMAAAQREACLNSAAYVHPTLAAHLSIFFFIATAAFSAACIGMAAGR